MNAVIRNCDGELMLLAPEVAGKYRPMSDPELFSAVRAGDTDAAVFLVFHRYGGVLVRLAGQYADCGCRDRLLAELVSELYCHLDRVGWDKALPREAEKVCGYLYVLERNLLQKMRMRDFGVHGGCTTVTMEFADGCPSDGDGPAAPRLPEYARLLSPDNPAQRTEEKDYVERMLACLSETRRFALCKRYMEGYRSAEVAEMLPGFWDSIGMTHPVDVPTGAYVDNMVSRAARQLRATNGYSRTWPASTPLR